MKKIKIESIDPAVFSFRGFDHIGCHKSCCDDDCCVHGADFDKESYELVHKYKDVIEPMIGVKVEDCFTHSWEEDEDFLGGDATESVVRNGFCAFHNPKGKGCVLYDLIENKGLPRRLVPSICRLYPLTWGGGELLLADDFYPKCNCLHKNSSNKNLIETEWEEIECIFELGEEALKQIEENK